VRPPCKSDSIRWRIDYQIATPGLAALAESAIVERAAEHAERWSDCAPVTVVFAP
jgi:exodeoxyribonuclease III